MRADDTVGRRMPLVGIELRCLGATVFKCFGFGGLFSFPNAEGVRRWAWRVVARGREVADPCFSACSALLDAKEICRRRLRPLEIDCLNLEELAESRFRLERDPFDSEFGTLMVSKSSFNGWETSVNSDAVGSGTRVSSRFSETNA